jgi:hypothetical protein
MGKEGRVLTSVKIPELLYEDFNVACVRDKFGLQKLVERAMFLYLTDSEFKSRLRNQLNTEYTGSL